MPTYADLEPQCVAWAAARGLLHPDGTANQATPESQHRKTMEEVGEAQESLELKMRTGTAYSCRALALELGDILVTLVLQSALQGVVWDECLASASRHQAGWGSTWRASQPSDPPCTWQFVEFHGSMLGMAIEQGHPGDARTYIGAVARCVEDVARVELALLGPECLELALAKIEGRRGETVNGVFVKEEE